MIYKGSQKEGKIYKGGTKIGKIYKGSQLVYQSQKSLRLYGYVRGGYTQMPCGMIGGFTTSFPYYQSTSNGTFYITIGSISGTLGQSGSQVLLPSGTACNYHSSHWVNGILIHLYWRTTNFHYGYWVMEGSTVGSTMLYCFFMNTDYTLGFPTFVDTSTMKYPIVNSIETANRDSSFDKTWTINGVY